MSIGAMAFSAAQGDVIKDLRQEVMALREALTPFAEAARIKPAMIGRGENTRDWTPPDEFIFPAGRITYGHVRAALKLMEGRDGST